MDLEHAAAKTRFDRLRASVGEHTPDGTRLLACSAFGASGFLRALPFTKELQLPNPVLLCAIRHRLHLPIPLIAHGPRRCTHNDAVYDVTRSYQHVKLYFTTSSTRTESTTTSALAPAASSATTPCRRRSWP